MSKKILITYASLAGSTKELAEAAREEFRKAGFETEILPVHQMGNVADFDGIFLGSSILAGKIQPKAMKALEQNTAALKTKKLAVFGACMALGNGTAEQKKEAENYLEVVQTILPQAETRVFAGKMDYSKLNFFLRMMIKNVIKVPEGDYRDFESFRSWTRELAGRWG